MGFDRSGPPAPALAREGTTRTAQAMIEVSNVHHRFGVHHVLRDVDLGIGERRVGVIGANGSGKSTFARLLNGLLIPDEGTVRVDGIDTREDVKAVRRRVGFVFQNPDNQIVFPVVEEDIAFGLKNLKLPKDEVARRVDAVLIPSWIAAAYVVGWLVEKNWKRLGFWNLLLFNVIGGIVVVYVIGIPWLAAVANMELGKAFAASAIFVPGDIAKAVVASFAALLVKRSYPLIRG